MKKATFMLSIDQFSALVKFAIEHGRSWKQELNAQWSDGRDARSPMGAMLRQIRNEAGPSWLNGFNFTTARVDYRGWWIKFEPRETKARMILAYRNGYELHEPSVEAMLKRVDAEIYEKLDTTIF